MNRANFVAEVLMRETPPAKTGTSLLNFFAKHLGKRVPFWNKLAVRERFPSKNCSCTGQNFGQKIKGASWNKLAVNWAKFWDGVLVREHAPIKNWSCTGQFFGEKIEVRERRLGTNWP